jgi:hypothetical protein
MWKIIKEVVDPMLCIALGACGLIELIAGHIDRAFQFGTLAFVYSIWYRSRRRDEIETVEVIDTEARTR